MTVRSLEIQIIILETLLEALDLTHQVIKLWKTVVFFPL